MLAPACFSHLQRLLGYLLVYALLASPALQAQDSETEPDGALHCPQLDLFYDDLERLSRKSTDSNRDCRFDQIIEYENGAPVRARQDRDHDGRDDA